MVFTGLQIEKFSNITTPSEETNLGLVSYKQTSNECKLEEVLS